MAERRVAEEAAAHVVSEEQLPSPSWAAPMPPGTERRGLRARAHQAGTARVQERC